MNSKFLLSAVMLCSITALYAQSNRSTTAYAITASEKGQSSWKEVRLVDVKTGQEIQTVFRSGQEIEILNARTGKPVQKKDDMLKANAEQEKDQQTQVFTIGADNKMQRVTGDADIEKLKAAGNKVVIINKGNHFSQNQGYDNPFATNSAAMAYDKKHERLYYTPMGINQLRYIDLRSKTPKIYFFEDEAFGTVKGYWDGASQITRMVIASDGNGYALTNDANHLIRFTTGKRPEITDLGAITETISSSDFTIHQGAGGDMVADNAGKLYLITAYKNVFKINIETRTSEYKGRIKGLPEGYQTNGAAVEEGTKIIVCSSRSTEAYYRFDLNTLQAEKISTGSAVFNASDLANANLVVEKKDKKEEVKKTEEVVPVTETTVTTTPAAPAEAVKNNSITVYPNPVTDGSLKISFNDLPAGRYHVQLMDLSGKIISNSEVLVTAKMQVQEMKLPNTMAKGNYLLKVSGTDSLNDLVTKITVQ